MGLPKSQLQMTDDDLPGLSGVFQAPYEGSKERKER